MTFFISSFIISNFNPRSREGSDFLAGAMMFSVFDFNPRSREGSDRYTCISILQEVNFNPRSREGSDNLPWEHKVKLQISIRAPARGATQTSGMILVSSRFQSALPRGERQGTAWKESVQRYISIRAPARGATCENYAPMTRADISIRAPARGATN